MVLTKTTNESGVWETIPLNEEELAQLAADQEAADLNLSDIRSERDHRLQMSDWTDLPNAPLTAEKAAEWQTYRQALRDHPGQSDRISTLPEWPTPPE
jgi:hypothetical protein